jgi:P27 family predicted phage terminase small subunit
MPGELEPTMPAQAKKPFLEVVREGNPGHRPVEPGLLLPLAELEEPDWAETFPVTEGPESAVNERLRLVARREWRRIVPVLKHTAGLAAVDAAALHEYCVVVARIDQCERALSIDGLLMQTERGWTKNGAATIVSQYRAHYKVLLREFGLSPSARRGITPVEVADDDDPFD